MARDLTTDTKNALIANEVHPILMFHASFDEGDIYYWTGYGDLPWDGQTWTGMGDFAGVSSLSETENIQANGAVFSLNGIPSAAVSMALTYEYRDRPCTLYLGVLNITTGALIADPYPLFGGRMDTMSIEDGADTGTISITAESQLIDLHRPREFRYTHQDQQNEYPGDLGLNFVVGLQDKEVSWGVASPSSAASAGTSKGRPTVRRSK
jgi:hypothetical protein